MAVTAFQTVGPFFQVLLGSRTPSRQVGDDATGERITITGVLTDGAGAPVLDGLVETWQADAHGRYRHSDDAETASADPAFNGDGWCVTDEHGGFRFATVVPGRVAGPDGRLQAPHILVSVMARGVLTRYVTRLYFEDAAGNMEDSILELVPADRRSTLMARRTAADSYRFDISLQGPNETVFFDV